MSKGNSKQKGSLVEFLASVRLTFAVLLILALVSILGTVIPQNLPPQEYVKLYGEQGGSLVVGLMLGDMYRAPWFLLLLALLALNLIVCSLKRVPTVLKILGKDPASEVGSMRSPQESFLVEGPPPEHEPEAQGILQRLVGAVSAGQKDGGPVYFAQKGGWSRWGVYVVHTSVLIIMAGAIIGKLWGFSGSVNIPEGQTVQHIFLNDGQHVDLPFQIRLDKFTVKFYPDGRPEMYRSDLVFLKDGKEAKKAVLMVNDPTDFDGIDFYQASYGESQTLDLAYHAGGKTEKITVPTGRGFRLPDGSEALVMQAFEKIDMGGKYSGAAARMLYRTGPEAQAGMKMAFQDGSPMQVAQGEPSFGILEIRSMPYSGLQVKRDPGVWLIWVGCTLMVIGFIIAFYFSHLKAWVRLAPAGKNRTRVEIATSTNKNKAAARRLASRLAAGLGAAGEAGGSAPDKD